MKKIFICCILVLVIIANVVYAEDVKIDDNDSLKSEMSEISEENKNQDISETNDKIEDDINTNEGKEIIQDTNKSDGENTNNQNLDENKVKKVIKVKGEQSIEDGEYEIRTVIDKNMIFEIDGGGDSSGAELQIGQDRNVKRQRFIVKYVGDGYYKITVRKSNKVLDVIGGSILSGTSIQQYDNNDTDAQRWIIKETEDGYYNIISKCNGLYGTVTDNRLGAKICMYESSGSNSQKFIFDKVLKEKGEQSIEDGEYEIRTVSDKNMIFDIDGGSNSSGAKLQIWQDCNVKQQRFIVKYMGDGCYKITIRKSNKVLDVVGADIQNGTLIQQYDSNNTDAQRWIIKETEDGYYNIISKCNGLYGTVTDNRLGAKICMYESNGENSQKFIFDKVLKEKGEQSIEDGEYEIRTVIDKNMIFDIDGGSNSSGAKLQIWQDCNVKQQRFIVKYMGDGCYKITIRKSNKVLDVVGADIQNGTLIQQYDSNNTDAQRWIIKETEDGYYNIISKCNGLYGTVTDNRLGAKICMYESSGNDSQKFIFDKVLKEKGKQSIEDGEYEIRTVSDKNMIFDIDGGSNSSGAKLQIWQDCNVKQQRFIVKYMGDGCYKITIRKSNKVLDVVGADIQNGTLIQQYDSNNTDAQRWIIKETEDGYYNIISKCNGLYGTVTDNRLGAKIYMCESSENDSQKFIFDKVLKEKGEQSIEDGEYEIRTVLNNNKVLDIEGGSNQSGAVLQIWDCCNVPQQRFKINYIGDGLYTIEVKKTGKFLDVVNGLMQNGNNIQQWDYNGTDAQKWIIKENDDKTYSIISTKTGLYMTLDNNEATNGTKILTFGKNEMKNQKFTFKEIKERHGIDVSSYQGNIDWKQVKESGIDFAMIRVGYRGWGTGKIVYDNNYYYNIENALKNNIECGVYFFSQAVNESEAIEEADFVINAIKQYNITYPVVIDSEYATSSKIGRADKLSVDDRTKVCRAFCDRIQQNGLTGMIYASKFWFYVNLDMHALCDYKIWLAHYTDSVNNKTDYKGNYDIWQYTNKGVIPGINGNVDLNIIF